MHRTRSVGHSPCFTQVKQQAYPACILHLASCVCYPYPRIQPRVGKMARVSLLLALLHIYPNPLPACLPTYIRTRLSLSYPVPGTWVPPSAFSPLLDGTSLGREHPTRQSRQAAFRRRWVNEGGRERKWGNPAHFFRSPAWHPEFERIPTCKRFEFFFFFFSGTPCRSAAPDQVFLAA